MREAARREAKIVCVNFLSAGWSSDTRADPGTQCCARCVFLFCYFPFMVVGGVKSVFVLVEKSWIWQRTDLSDLFFVKNGKRVWEGRKNACRTTYLCVRCPDGGERSTGYARSRATRGRDYFCEFTVSRSVERHAGGTAHTLLYDVRFSFFVVFCSVISERNGSAFMLVGKSRIP